MKKSTSDTESPETGKEVGSEDSGTNSTKLEAPEDSHLRISRGPRPEVDVDFEKLRPLFVYDEFGIKIRFVDIFQKQKTILVFTRHFLDFITKEYVEDLAIIPTENLKEANVNMVVIGPSPFKFIKAFKKLTNYKYALYTDPDREVYKALGLYEKMGVGKLEKSKHIKSWPMVGVLTSMWRAMQYQEYQGDPKQQGGSFIMGPGETVDFCHLDESCSDHMNINDLLLEAGVQAVSFPNDQRVITI